MKIQTTTKWESRHAGAPSDLDVGNVRASANVNMLKQQLRDCGAAVFSGVSTRDDLLALAEQLMSIAAHPDGDDAGLTTIAYRRQTAHRPNAAGFSRQGLLAHTDRSGVYSPPMLLLTCCTEPASKGGQSGLINGLAIHDDLATTCPQALAAFSRPRTVLFGGSAGYLGSVFTNVPAVKGASPPPRRTIRLRLDDLGQFSPEIAVWLPALQAAIDRHTHLIDLPLGHGYVLNNHRWLHSRDAFEGARTLLRLHGDPLPDLGLQSGFPCDTESGG